MFGLGMKTRVSSPIQLSCFVSLTQAAALPARAIVWIRAQTADGFLPRHRLAGQWHQDSVRFLSKYPAACHLGDPRASLHPSGPTHVLMNRDRSGMGWSQGAPVQGSPWGWSTRQPWEGGERLFLLLDSC